MDMKDAMLQDIFKVVWLCKCCFKTQRVFVV